uniref:Uncharacterized protein n=1 Tax=Meloidogyne incognita TaxID=6306 RepID=A0A914N528_MELIC
MQDRKVYIENERFNMNPEPGELFSYVDNGPIFGAQGWAPPPPVLNGPPPQISPDSIQPLNSLPNSVNNDSYGNNQQKYDSPVRRAPLRRTRPPSRKRSRGGSGINNKRLIGRNYEKGGRQLRKDERSSNNKNISKRYNVSPLRENTKTSSSSGTYGTRPHSIESSIMNRITIDEPPSVGKVSSIHSRLSFENP